MKKVAILIENQFDEQELIYPYHRLREDFTVELIGSEKDTQYKSKSGFALKSDLSSKEAKAEDYLGLFIPGGFSPDYMRRSPKTLAFVEEMHRNHKPISAICHGPWVLASAIDLKGKDITSFPSIQMDLKHAGANWVDKEVVVSDNIVTSRNPMDLPANLKEFMALLKKTDK